jgi:hypothetical protein
MGCRNRRYWPQPLQQHHHPGILRLVLPLFWLAGSTILGLWGFALTRRMSAEIELQYVRQRHYDRGMGPGMERSSRRASVLSAATIPLSSSLQPAVASWHPRIAHTTIHQAREWQSVHRPRSIKHAQTLQYPLLLRPSYSDADTNATVELDRTRLYGLTNASLDFPHMELRRWPVHELDPEHCVTIASWQSHFYPVCNVVHEHSFQEGLTLNSNVSVGIGSEGASDGRLELLSSKGFWRDAWKMDQPTRDGTMTTTVWRTFK